MNHHPIYRILCPGQATITAADRGCETGVLEGDQPIGLHLPEGRLCAEPNAVLLAGTDGKEVDARRRCTHCASS